MFPNLDVVLMEYGHLPEQTERVCMYCGTTMGWKYIDGKCGKTHGVCEDCLEEKINDAEHKKFCNGIMFNTI